jgi:hypothetical protein
VVVALDFLFHDDKATHVAHACPLTLGAFVVRELNALDHLEAIDARDAEVGTYGLMHLNLFPNALGLAVLERLALD